MSIRIFLSRSFQVLLASVIGLCATNNALALDWVGSDLSGVQCRGNETGFGPFDYFDVNEKSDPLYQEGRLWEIDKLHTDRAVEIMVSGPLQQSGYQAAAKDLDYTLRAIPNEPRALQEMVKLYFMVERSDTKFRIVVPRPECYFLRAQSFRPNQSHISLLYGIYLHQLKLYPEAIAQYERAVQIDSNATEAHYNLGLALLKLDRTSEAAEHARIAYELGHPLPGLRNALSRRGVSIVAESKSE